MIKKNILAAGIALLSVASLRCEGEGAPIAETQQTQYPPHLLAKLAKMREQSQPKGPDYEKLAPYLRALLDAEATYFQAALLCNKTPDECAHEKEEAFKAYFKEIKVYIQKAQEDVTEQLFSEKSKFGQAILDDLASQESNASAEKDE